MAIDTHSTGSPFDADAGLVIDAEITKYVASLIPVH